MTTCNKQCLIAHIKDQGLELKAALDNLKTLNTPQETENPQTLWKKFKEDIRMLAKNMTGKSHHKITVKIKKLQEDIRALTNLPDIDNEESAQANIALMTSELAHLEKIVACEQKDYMKALLANHRECLGGPWSAMSEEKKLRDLILQLRIPRSNPPPVRKMHQMNGYTCKELP